MSAAFRAACARAVEAGDPDRFAAARLAGEGAWKLHALYAFNLEIAKIPAATSEPLLAQIRLQWWRDAVAEIFDGASPRAHEVVAPLAQTIRDAVLPRALFDALLDARAEDVQGLKLSGGPALARYLEASSGGLMQLAALALGGMRRPERSPARSAPPPGSRG